MQRKQGQTVVGKNMMRGNYSETVEENDKRKL